MIWLFFNRCCDTTFLTSQLFSRLLFYLGTFVSSKALGRDPQESDQDKVIVSRSDTQSDDEENCSNDSASQQMTETTTAAAPPLEESSEQISDNTKAAAPPLDSASQEIELPPLLSDPEASVPETELIERDFNAMEAELTRTTAENYTQVASFALIFKNEHAFFQHLIDLSFSFFLSFFLSLFFISFFFPPKA